jgi:flagellar protein FliL
VKKKTQIDIIGADPPPGQPGSPEKGEGGEPSDQELPALKKGKSKLLYLAAACLLLGGGVGGAGYLGYLPIPGLSQAKPSEPKVEKPASMGPTVKLSPLVINLKEEGGRNYLKTTIVLEVEGKNEAEEIQKKLSHLTDMIILTVSDKKLDDLRKPDFKEGLKNELLAKIRKDLNLQKVQKIYFDEFLFQ